MAAKMFRHLRFHCLRLFAAAPGVKRKTKRKRNRTWDQNQRSTGTVTGMGLKAFCLGCLNRRMEGLPNAIDVLNLEIQEIQSTHVHTALDLLADFPFCVVGT